MKKQLFAIAYAVAPILFLLTSCDILGGGIALNQEGAGEKIKDKIEKNLDPEAVVYHVTFYTDDEFSYKLRMIDVYYSQPGSDEVSCTEIHLSPANVREGNVGASYKKRKPDNGIALKDLDFSIIPSNISTAISFLADNDIKTSGMGMYNFNIESADAQAINHKFTLHERGKTTTVGNRQQIEYFKYDFISDSEGNVEYKE